MNTQILTIDYRNKKDGCELNIPVTLLLKPENESDYKKQEKLLHTLIDIVGNDEEHPLADVMAILGNNLEDYDDHTHPPIGANLSHVDIVKYYMKAKNLVQKDIAGIFGGQGNVSRFLNNERSLNVNQIKNLSELFNVPPDIFFGSVSRH